jgi:hypothetical protein
MQIYKKDPFLLNSKTKARYPNLKNALYIIPVMAFQ